MSWSRTDLLLIEVRALLDAGMPLSEAVSFVTVNAADRLGQAEHKGRVAERYDADLLLLEPDRSVYGVIARGQTMVWAGKTVKTGYFGGGAK
jgi:imidazolonepropionase-like amidohydrolase